MRKIPIKLRNELANDEWYCRCCLCGDAPVEWHHAIKYRGCQVNERWAIVPACKDCHQRRLKELELVALERATDEDFAKYPNHEHWIQRRKYLQEKLKRRGGWAGRQC